MHTQDITLPTWEHPRDYGGFSPDGDFLLLSRNRDSSALDRSNWDTVCAAMGASTWDARDTLGRPAVYHWRAGHWACGWIEYLMVRADASEDILAEACEIHAALKSYPVFDESHFSQLESDEALACWSSSSLRTRMEWCRIQGVSIFAARRDDDIPPGVEDELRFL